MATPGCKGQALHPAQQAAAALPPGTGFTICTPSLTLGALKVCSWSPFSTVLGWPTVGPASLRLFLANCDATLEPAAMESHSALSWVLCVLKCKARFCWGLVRPLAKATCRSCVSAPQQDCCSGSRFRGNWNHVFVNRV